jgi:hypothetical protein
MTEKKSDTGWVVQLAIPGLATQGGQWRGTPLADAPTFKFFNVAVSVSEKAIEVARKLAGASEEAPMTAVRKLLSSEIEFLGLRTGEARPA